MPITTANVTTDGTAVYTSSGNTAVTFMSLCNYSAGNVLANIHVVPNGQAAGNLNLVITQLELSAAGNGTGDTYQLYLGGEKLLLGPGDFIEVDANANSAVAVVTSFTSI
jgi:hypothetical protein